MRRVGSSLQRISKPLEAHQYNCSYGHINTFNSYRAKYKVGRNSKKAWKYIFYVLIDAAIVNVFLLYKENSTHCTNIKGYDQFRFCLEIGHSLIRGFSSRKCDYSRISTMANNPSNILMHENVHMHAKLVKRCAFHWLKLTPKKSMKLLMDANCVIPLVQDLSQTFPIRKTCHFQDKCVYICVNNCIIQKKTLQWNQFYHHFAFVSKIYATNATFYFQRPPVTHH